MRSLLALSPERREIPFDQAFVDRLQLQDLGDGRGLVDLVHGLADQAELDHRAKGADEPGVRCAAGGGELRIAAGDVADGGGGEVGEGAGLGQEGLAADLRGDGYLAREAA